jgi:hypothetical protein
MYFVYVIYSEKLKRFYTGATKKHFESIFFNYLTLEKQIQHKKTCLK